jgi:hypothetical protein
MAWSDLIAALEASTAQDQWALQQPIPDPECRVYHNGVRIVEIVLGPGWPDYDLPWIDVDPKLYDSISNLTYRIVENCLVPIDFTIRRVVQLKKAESGPFRTVKGMSTILLEDSEKYESTQYYTNS